MSLSSELESLLNDVASEDTDKYTHASLVPHVRRWHINSGNMGKFWDMYCNMVKHNASLCLTEKNEPTMPLIVDFKFKFDVPDDDDLHNDIPDEFELTLVSIIQQTILDLFNINSDNKSELICCVLEPNKSWVEASDDDDDIRILCKSLRLQFPYCHIDADVATHIVIPKLISMFRNRNVIKILRAQTINNWDDIIDVNVMSKDVLMYGSSVNEPVKYMSHIYGIVTVEHIQGTVEPPYLDLDDALSPKCHSDVSLKNIDDDILASHITEYWVPLMLSVRYKYDKALELKKSVITKKPAIKTRITLGAPKIQDYSPLSMCKAFIQMLSPNRIKQGHYWMDIGRALYTSTNGGPDGLQEWETVTSNINSDDLDAELCHDYYYQEFNKTPITYKTLAWYAKIDNPNGYTNWHNIWFASVADESLANPSVHTDIAKAFYRCYWLTFIFRPDGKGIWYYFDGTRWREDQLSLKLQTIMSNDFVRKYEELRHSISQQILHTSDEFSKLNLENKITKITKLIDNLKKQHYKTQLTNAAREMFNYPDIGEHLNQNKFCIGHVNLISEVVGDHIEFRPGKPEDYISKSTGNKIDTSMTWNHPQVKIVMHWFSQVFCDKDLRETFFKYGASWYFGSNTDKCIPCWTGEGDNSKSAVEKAFEMAFGQYCFKVPTSLFNSNARSNANDASPALAQMEGARGGFSDEMDEDKPINSAIIKKLASKDSFFTRFLHQNGGKVESMFKLSIICNKVPRIDSTHPSVTRKFFLIPFLTTFSYDAPKDPAEQIKMRCFPRDDHFDDKIPALAPAILWVFAQFYPAYHREGLTIPQIVRDYTDNYWNDIDVYKGFASEFIRPAWKDEANNIRNTDAKITVSQAYIDFKLWFKSQNEGERIPDSRTFRGEMIKRLGPLSNSKYWLGVTLSSQEPVNLTLLA